MITLPKGPWRQSALDRTEVIADDGWLVAYASNRGDPQTSEAVARLIAAAPELLEALKECALHIEYFGDTFGPAGSGRAVEARARAAIAKAEKQE